MATYARAASISGAAWRVNALHAQLNASPKRYDAPNPPGGGKPAGG
ncbi:hypothetical protein KEK_02941 [Mycolicibacterium thermoresistibile ATCC 19527]|uniref:Uncharacterized protein n=1 Tax=Mycolicibacterium thermoresistibile (strain ATCC 19527 / DSM 44167 / CIP 105390 / JCM 6362 / NCTC 10409 / 316) TaxID=1078020 RepID=G7CC93_MYCT3|nr:hypothetical protein KEK_02941 [Mycolicibacterium thermoresistibile ATCC 19527]